MTSELRSRSFHSTVPLAAALLVVPAFLALRPAGAASPAPQAAESYSIDGSHSTAMFKVTHLNVSNFYGRFDKIKGSVAFDAKNPAASSVSMEIDAESVNTADTKRDQHLRSTDFLSAKEFPTLSFKSKSVKKLDERSFEIAGDFTLRGVTKPITVKATHTGSGKDPWGGFRQGFETTFSIPRADYGIKYMPGALGDEVQITISIEAVKKEAK